VAVNCTVLAAVTDVLAGVMAIDCSTAAVTFKVAVACCAPVATVIDRGPAGAFDAMATVATALVALVTVTGPNNPNVPPPTAIPVPKFACVAPCTKFVKFPVMLTLTVCPTCPVAGLKATLAGGLMVIVEELSEEKDPPVEVVPLMDTRKFVGASTLMLAGIVNKTRRVLPTNVVMEDACVLTDAPPPEGARVTVTFPGDIVPLGNPEPVTELEETPA